MTTVALTGNVPEVLVILEEKLKALKTIEETAWKCPTNLDGFGNIQSEMKIENLIRAYSSVKMREEGYTKAAIELGLKTYPAFNINGCNVEQWKHDIDLRIQIINHKETFDKLTTFKDKMSSFLSAEDQKGILMKEMSDFLTK